MNKINQSRRDLLKLSGFATALWAFPVRAFSASPSKPKITADKVPTNDQFRLFSGLLRLYDEFDPLPDKQAPGFQYECSHPELARMRDKYQLDRVAGTGDDWSKVLNLILNPWEVRDLLCRHKPIVCNDELAHNGARYSSEDYLRYLAKNLFYMHSPTFSSFNSSTTSEKPWLTLTPKHFDVCKREAYNMKWRKDGNDGNWETDELEKLRREECFLVLTSSIASFAQKPA